MSFESLSFSTGFPDFCGPFPLPSGSYAMASLLSISAQVLFFTPLQTVTLEISIEAAITIFNFYGVERCAFTVADSIIIQVPAGANRRPDVAIRSATIISAQITESFQVSTWRLSQMDDALVDLNPTDPFVKLEVLVDLVLSEQLGICPPDATGAPACDPFTAKDCILVNKVYDQCFTEELVTSQIPVTSACPGVTIPAGATVGCFAITNSATCTYAGTVAVTPPLTPFFEEVLVINSFDVSAPIFVAGVTVCEPTLTLTGAARADLWVPPGTTVNCDILSFGDCTCTLLSSPTGLPAVLTCTGKICKEIQVTAPVKLLVPSFGFCEVPACTFLPQPGFACPPTPLFPPERQTSSIIQLVDILGVGIAGIVFSVLRLGSVIASATTDMTGTAAFPGIGGLQGGIDVVTFTFLSKQVSFPIPLEFIDITEVAHDSASSYSLVFTRTTVLGTRLTVTLNGFVEGTGALGVPLIIDVE